MSTDKKHQAGRIRHWLHPGEPHYDDAIEAIGFAMLRGYSLVYIKRIFGMNRARHLYEVLLKEGIIQPLPQKKYKHDPLPSDLLDALAKVDLRFPRWCHARHPPLNPATAAKMLNAPITIGNIESERAHRAVSQDFPFIYRKIYGHDLDAQVPPYKEYPGPKPRPTYVIKPMNQVYVAEAQGLDLATKVFGYGLSADDALKKLLHELAIRRAIMKTNLLQDQNPD